MVVVAEAGVIVAFARRVGRRGRRVLLHHVVVLLAVEGAAFAQRELVAGHQLSRTCAAPEALYVVDLALGAHHKVVFTERGPALITFCTEQPARNKDKAD